MVMFVGIAGVLQIVVGILVYLVAKSAVHEILGAIMFGMGVIALGLVVLANRADRQIEALNRLRA